jgi:RND superfamily putative drug exporter
MSARIKQLVAAPGGRRTKWLALAVWILLVAALGPLAGKLGDVEDTGPNAFLPRSAESAELNTELEKFRGDPDDEIMPAVAVYSVPDGAMTAVGRQQAAADVRAFAPYVAEGERVTPPVPSDDGGALMTVVPIADEDDLGDTIDAVRDVAADGAPPGVDVEVGGPAASLADSVAVFDSLDATLMLATLAVVTVLLLMTYRSPVLWLLPVLAVGFAAVLTQAVTYLLATHASLPVDPQAAGILMVLVFGVGTDYALLLIARYREELHRHEDRHAAMQLALRRCFPAVLASAATIAVGLSCLYFADISSSRSLGLVGAVGAVCAFLALVTVLPALLVIVGRWVFWPFVPRHGAPVHGHRTVWSRIGAAVARRPRRSWLMSLGVTAVLAVGVAGMDFGLKQSELFQDKPESVVAQERISAHYPSGASDPADIVTKAGAKDAVRAAAGKVPGVAGVADGETTRDGELAALRVTLDDEPDSDEAKDTVDALRAAVSAVDGADALVGGTTAEALDTQRAADRDLRTVVPIVLAVVFLVLIGLLRALVAPLVLLATAVLSNVAALGASYLLFDHVFDFAAVDWSIPLMGFVFLTALGIDYNIFLMTRVREEVAVHGHAMGVIAGLTSTGGVITSAGIVLAATFAVFAGLPLVTMAQLGVLVGVGVLLDTFLVRTVMVPALVLDLGRWTWWPGALFRREAARAGESGADRASGGTADALPEADRVRA